MVVVLPIRGDFALAVAHFHVVANRRAHINLSGTADFALCLRRHFAPVCNPPRHSADCENHREHVGRHSDCFENDSAVKIDVGVEVSRHKIVVASRHFFEPLGDVEKRVFHLDDFQHLFRGGAEDFRARVVCFVEPVSEAHQTRLALFRRLDERAAVVAAAVDFFEHLDNLLVCAAVERAPERADARRNRGEQVCAGACDHSDGRCGAVLLVVCVEQEDKVEGFRDVVVRVVLVVRLGEHHVQEILAVSQVALGVDEGQPVFHSVSHCGNRADFAKQERGGVVEVLQVLLPVVCDHVGVVAADRV